MRPGDVLLLERYFPAEVRPFWFAEVVRRSRGTVRPEVVHFVVFKPGGGREPFERMREPSGLRLASAVDLVVPDGPR